MPLQKKSQESVDRFISERKHVSRSARFVFEEDIPIMPKGRVLFEDRVREKKDPDWIVIRTVTKSTVIASEKDFFALVDRGASIEVIAEIWGLGRHCLTEAAKDAEISDPVFEPYRKAIRARAMKERAQCRAKATERRADGNKGSESTVIPRLDYGNKGADS